MMKRFGIYGYECTCLAEFDFFKIIPVSNDYSKVDRLASDLNAYNLTSFLEINDKGVDDEKQFIFDLQGVLSFIDQKEVLVSNLLREHESYESLDKDYPTKMLGNARCNSGKVVMSDAVSDGSRKIFIEMALKKLSDKTDPVNKVFRGAFFRVIEVFRQADSFIDVKYYLLFSALESLSRAVFDDYDSKNCSVLISKFMSQCNLGLVQDDSVNLYRSVSTYGHLRNALFHNGKFEKTINLNGSETKLELSKYYSQFEMLLPLVMMKYIGFDDGYINWNSWLDRMMFKDKT